MDFDRTLASAFVTAHPKEASRVLETIAVAEAAELLAGLAPEHAAGVLERASSEFARAILIQMTPPQAGGLLAFPPDTAGAVMDPRVLALAWDLSAEEALARVREAPAHVLYNLYIVDREQRLQGVLNLRELLLASPPVPLDTVMRSAQWRLPALGDRRAVVEHPGWREVHSLPVVDRQGRFLGAIRYRTMRRLEDALRERMTAPTAEALGDLFWTGVAGLLDAVVEPRR